MNMKLSKKTINIIAIVFVVALLISIIPIIAASFYSHPVADDFGFSAKVNHAVKNGGGLFEILSESFQKIKSTYMTWQGTYSAVLIFSLQPAAFSENLYFLTAIVMLTALIASTVFFINTIFKSLGYNKKYGLIISCIILLLSIHFVINKNEAFFWWNGCSYYTLFYAFSLIYFSILIKLYFAEKTGKKTVLFIISLLLSVLIAGGNYSTALVTTVVLALVLCLLMKKRGRKMWFFLINFIVLLVGFAVNMVAPGNAVRATTVTATSPIEAIALSVFYGLIYIAEWTGLAQLAGFLIIAIIAFKLTRNSKMRFKYPLLVFAVSFLIFATQLTPPLYAMSSVGSGRQINIYYYSYYLLMIFNIFYFCGWLNQREIVKVKCENIKKSYAICGFILLAGIFVGGCFNHGVRELTFVDTLLALKNNTPQTYSSEYMNIMTDIKNGNTEVEDIKTVPDFFAPLNIKEDPTYWTNSQIAAYYGVDGISLKSDSEKE